MQFISGSVTKAKATKEDAEYSKVTDTLRTDLEAKYTAATSLLEGETKLKNLDADGTLATTQASLESAKTALDAAVSALMPELTFAKTKASAAAKVTELDALVNTALKAELQRQVNELTKEQADQATTILANLTSLKDSLTSLQDLVSKGLAMQVDYPRNYYDADNKADFDAALLKASSVFPAFKWTEGSIMVETPEGQLPNPRAWTKARDKSEFKLQNFVMAPTTAQAATPSATEDTTSTAASATVRLATGEAAEDSESSEAQTAPTADLASTASYLKSLNDTLKAATDALNGDNPKTKTAYYKADAGRTLYWDGFMPKIVLEGFDSTWRENSEENERKIRAWFDNAINWAGLSDQLTKKLGVERFKNVVLSNPTITVEDVMLSSGSVKFPKVTFRVAAKDGYQLASGEGTSTTLELKIRVLYSSSNPNALLLPYQEASSSAAPRGAIINDANVKANVNVYLNYTGPSIVLNADLPTVGGQENTSINGTSNLEDEFNTAFRGNPSRGLLFTNRYANPLLKSVINYVNKFDPKYRAEFVTNATNGVTITKVEKTKELRPGTLDDLNKNNVFLQQIQGDTEAVYFAVSAIASNNWLNTFLIRIPLTKFVRPISVLQTPDQQQTQEGGEEATQPQNAGSGTASTSEAESGQSNGPAGSGTGSTQQAQSSPTTGTSSSSN
ncbi:hypothetical protein [Mycoplasmopsis synoviae]|uniref:hypothetical protein n=1 Tax=Mycoplasmopsis synoviae TaxID=2109 RepID=UPI0034DAD540